MLFIRFAKCSDGSFGAINYLLYLEFVRADKWVVVG